MAFRSSEVMDARRLAEIVARAPLQPAQNEATSLYLELDHLPDLGDLALAKVDVMAESEPQADPWPAMEAMLSHPLAHSDNVSCGFGFQEKRRSRSPTIARTT